MKKLQYVTITALINSQWLSKQFLSMVKNVNIQTQYLHRVIIKINYYCNNEKQY